MTPEKRDEILRRKEKWADLLALEGWSDLEKLAKAQIEARERQMLTLRMNSQEKISEFERLGGSVEGIRLFLTLPVVFLQQVKEELENEDE